MAEADPKYFDLQIVHDHYERSLIEDDDINLEAYLQAYYELFKFFQLMGSVFGFVSTDLYQKLDILDKLRKADTVNYESVKKMIDYEKKENLLNKKDFVNGCRTLLRLHRGLDFIQEFLKQLAELDDSVNCSQSCRDAYNKTLGRHHSWFVKKAAVYAMYTMPTREVLLKRVCGEEVQRNLEVLPQMLEVTANVLKRTQSVYEENELTQLQ